MVHENDTEEFVIRKLTDLGDFARCVEMQFAVWGYAETDIIPRKVFLLASHIGGQVLGAFAGDRMVGFAMGLPGYRNGHAYLHSHMLAVLPEFRNRGLGVRLKLAQREDAVARGIELIEWTFDPLEIKNAHLNIGKLGAIARRYRPNFYGASSSPLQGGLPTDRLVAEWWLRSARVEQVLSGGGLPAFRTETQVRVPAAVHEWKASAQYRESARRLQAGNEAALVGAFSAGQAVLGHHRTPEGDGVFLLGRWDEPFVY